MNPILEQAGLTFLLMFFTNLLVIIKKLFRDYIDLQLYQNIFGSKNTKANCCFKIIEVGSLEGENPLKPKIYFFARDLLNPERISHRSLATTYFN